MSKFTQTRENKSKKMKEESQIKMKSELKAVFDIIDIFKISDHLEYVLPIELSSKQRVEIHEYAKCAGLYSESILSKGSEKKKIIIRRHPKLLESDNTDGKIKKKIMGEESIIQYVKLAGLKISCCRPEYIEYYVKLYNSLYGTIDSWKLFCEEFQAFDMIREENNAINAIKKTIQENPEYLKMMETETILKGPSKIKILKNDVYTLCNIGSYFLSIDMKSSNSTILRQHCPSIFEEEKNQNLMSWEEFVKRFTKSDFIAESKKFREVSIGLTNFQNRARVLQELFMDDIHNITEKWNVENDFKLELKMKRGDELVYKLKDYKEVIKSIDQLKHYFGPDKVSKLHIRLFHLDRVPEKEFFVKSFVYNTDTVSETAVLKSKIEFKKVPDYFIPQVIKWFLKQDVVDEDLMYTFMGIPSKFMVKLFET